MIERMRKCAVLSTVYELEWCILAFTGVRMATWNSPSKFEKVDEPEVSRVRTDIQLMCVSTNVMSQKYSSRVNDRSVIAPRQCGVVVICCGRASTLYVCILTIRAHIHVAGRLRQPEVARHFESAVRCRKVNCGDICHRRHNMCLCVVCIVCCKGRSCASGGALSTNGPHRRTCHSSNREAGPPKSGSRAARSLSQPPAQGT